jgi:hypothetical protein
MTIIIIIIIIINNYNKLCTAMDSNPNTHHH